MTNRPSPDEPCAACIGHAREYGEAAQGGDTEAALAALVAALIHTWTQHPTRGAAADPVLDDEPVQTLSGQILRRPR